MDLEQESTVEIDEILDGDPSDSSREEWRDRPPVDIPRSHWEWAAANWLRFAVLLISIGSVASSTAARQQTITNRNFGKGSREIQCALLFDHTKPGTALYSLHSVETYNRQCKGVR